MLLCRHCILWPCIVLTYLSLHLRRNLPNTFIPLVGNARITKTLQHTGQRKQVRRSTANLPQTAAGALFTVAGRVVLMHIVGEVTKAIQTQANNTKVTANGTVGASVDMCAVLDITGDALGTLWHITGTLANALVATTSSCGVAQAAPLLLAAGTIDLDCAASNAGQTKWTVRYIPLDAGALVTAA